MRRSISFPSAAARRAPVLALALVVTVGCGGEEPAPAGEGSPADTATPPIGTPPAPGGNEAPGGSPSSYVYRCGEDFAVAARSRGDSVALVLPGRDFVLPRVVSASGARYAKEGVVFWEEDGEARVELPDTVFTGCERSAATDPWNEAALRGVAARALGQEPGWIAEVDPDRFLSLELDYGERRILLPPPTTRRQRAETGEAGEARPVTTIFRSRTEGHDATLRFVPEPCTDLMSGRRFPYTVRLEIDGDVYEGCGRIFSHDTDIP